MKHLITVTTVTLGLALGAHTRAELIGQWTFNEGAGTTAADSRQNQSATLHNGVKWAESGPDNRAVVMDGTSGCHIEVGRDVLYAPTVQITLEVWVKPEVKPASGQECLIFGKDTGIYALTFYTDGNAYFYINSGGNHIKHELPLGEYTHLVGTYDGALMRLYINGEEVARKEFTEKIHVGNHPLLLGYGLSTMGYQSQPNQEADTYSFCGSIDEARVYNHALTEKEVSANFKKGPEKGK